MENFLSCLGYVNEVWILNARHFGIPQKRERCCMISVFCKDDRELESRIFEEAQAVQINDTESRRRICLDNDRLVENGSVSEIDISTLTTRQDRNPNSGVVEFPFEQEGKLPWRYLTARETFLLMGFEDRDYETVDRFNSECSGARPLIAREACCQLTGNSIVVDVLEAVFEYILEMNDMFFDGPNQTLQDNSAVRIQNADSEPDGFLYLYKIWTGNFRRI